MSVNLAGYIVEGISLGLIFVVFVWLITLPISVFVRMMGW